MSLGQNYLDTYSQAASDCSLIGSGITLLGFDPSYISDAIKFPPVKSYLDSGSCGEYVLFLSVKFFKIVSATAKYFLADFLST